MMKHIFPQRLLAHALVFIGVGIVVSATVAHADGSLQNPLKFSGITEFVAGALKVLVMVALPIISLYFVLVGYHFISAQGNAGELQKARANFVYTVLGALLILGAWVIATMIGGTVSQLAN